MKSPKITIIIYFVLLIFISSDHCFSQEINNEALLKCFPDENVKEYVEKIINNKFTCTVFPAPKEMNDVAKIGKPAVPVMLSLLDDEDYLVRLSASFVLQDITNKHFLIDTYKNDDPKTKNLRKISIKEMKAWWKVNKDKSNLQWLEDDLISKKKTDKESAVINLGEMGDKRAIPALRKALKDKMIRFFVIESLAELGDECMTPYVINSYMDNVDEFYRERAPKLIEKVTGENFGFDSKADQKLREEAIDRAKEWWEMNKTKFDCTF